MMKLLGLTNAPALIERQQDVMRLQDGMMLDIEKGVDRLYGQVRQDKSI